MAKEGTLKTIIKISRENYEILINGGTVGGYTYDPEALYLVKDGYTYITDDEIRCLWWGNCSGLYIKDRTLFSVDNVKSNTSHLDSAEYTIKNGVMYF